jgi:hypothetical protein
MAASAVDEILENKNEDCGGKQDAYTNKDEKGFFGDDFWGVFFHN